MIYQDHFIWVGLLLINNSKVEENDLLRKWVRKVESKKTMIREFKGYPVQDFLVTRFLDRLFFFFSILTIFDCEFITTW